jgi:hypothetical protein
LPSNTQPQEPAGSPHVGFSLEALQASADESASLAPGQDPSVGAIKQFVVDVVAANNAALFLDFKVLSEQYEELRARVQELELLLGVSDALSAGDSIQGIIKPIE